MQIRAAVVTEQGKPLTIETLELAPPGDGEVLVEIKAAGVCHSDLHAISGDWPMKVPLVPGHEGAGIVEASDPESEWAETEAKLGTMLRAFGIETGERAACR